MTPESVDDAPSPPPAVTTPATPAKPTPTATPTKAPTSPSANSSGTAPAPAAAPAPAVVTVEGDTGAVVMVALPDGQLTPLGAAVTFAVLDLSRGAPRNGTLVATWESASPLDASMDVSLSDTDGNSIAAGTGASPLSIEISGAAFAQALELRGLATPTAPGVAIQYSVHLALTVAYA
ncbi:MAG TPA: hypothetical protein VM370_08515 [Candidatus Thermoplasmatota archaeon]|nr:hypothetical protein [Candidatus Thermoplasmatota archaeon]